MSQFTPEQEKEFEFRQRYEQEQAQQPQQQQAQSANDAKDVESATNSVVYPAVAAGAAAASGSLPSKIVNGMVQDPVTGKWMAVENYGRQMAQGKYYGGKNYNQVWDKIREYNTDPTQGPRLEKEAMANRSTGQKVLSKIPKPLQGIASSPMGAFGKGIVGLGAGMQGADALNRYNEGDTSGAVISGIGAMGTAASMLPHPVARIGGTAVGLGAEGLNMFLDKLKNKKQMAKGGLVDEEDGLSKAEKAALKIMKNKKKVKHLAGGGTTTATGDSTFNNTNVGMPNIVLPAMGVNPDGTTTPAPPQIWNEFTGQYQSQEDTTPGAMPGPRGGLSGLLAGENPVAPNPIPDIPNYLSGPLGGVNQTVAQNSLSPFKTPISQNDPTTGVYQQSNNTTSLANGLNQLFSPSGFGGGMAGGTQNLLNPQGAAQINPNSAVAAASPPNVNFASAMRPGVKQNVFNKFGTPLNQIRQSPGTTPQAPSVNTSRRRLPRLVRPR
jgi:hypothetical protein